MSDAIVGLYTLPILLNHCHIQRLQQQPHTRLRMEESGMGQGCPSVCISDQDLISI